VLEISIFVLEINNIILKIMKKTVFVISVSVITLVSTVILILNIWPEMQGDNLQLLLFFVPVAFGFYMAYRRISSTKRGLPAEDEFSKKVRGKAASLAFFISAYFWLGLMFLSEHLKKETHTMISWGVLGMIVIFIASWVYYNFRGMRNE
jgi:uncharacterized membrane protein